MVSVPFGRQRSEPRVDVPVDQTRSCEREMGPADTLASNVRLALRPRDQVLPRLWVPPHQVEQRTPRGVQAGIAGRPTPDSTRPATPVGVERFIPQAAA